MCIRKIQEQGKTRSRFDRSRARTRTDKVKRVAAEASAITYDFISMLRQKAEA